MSFFVYSGLPFYKEETYKKYVISSEKREPKPQTEKKPLSPEFDLRYSKFYFTHILMIEQSNIIWWSVITAVTVSSYDSLQQHMYMYCLYLYMSVRKKEIILLIIFL